MGNFVTMGRIALNKNKQLAINMVAQMMAFAINLGISFLLTPYIVKYVGEEAYGFVGLANNFTGYATIITTALNSMAGRFITLSIHRGEHEDTSKYFTSVVMANLFISFFLTIAGGLVLVFLDRLVNVPGNILSDVTLLWALLFASFIIGLVGNVFGVATFARNRLELSSLQRVISNVINAVILVVAFLLFQPHVWYLGLSAVVCGLYTIGTNVYYTKKLLPFVRIRRRYFDLKKIKTLVLSGMWNSFSSISSMLSTGLDLLITNWLVGSAAMGVVSISKTLPAQILSIFSTLSSTFAPQITISYAKNDMEDIKRQLVSAVRLLGFFACIPIAFLYVYGRDFFTLWMPGQDAGLLHVLSLLSAGAFIFALPLEPMWNIFTVTNKVRQSSLFLLFNAIVSTLLVFILLQYPHDDRVKMYIVVGVSTILSIIRALTFLPLYGAACLHFKWYTFYPVILRNIAVVAVVTLVCLGIKLILPSDSWTMLLVNGVVVVLLSCTINYFLMLGKEEREILKSRLFKWRRKK